MQKNILSRVRCLFILCALLPSLSAAKPLKVFVLVGQSNMQGHAKVATLDHAAMDAKMKPLLEKIRRADGSPRVSEDVWISYLSSKGVKSGALQVGFGADDTKIGPELAFGVVMQEYLGEPILLIKAAWGGKSINTDFRPPSAGPYPFHEKYLENLQKRGKDVEKIKAVKAKATGHYYRLTIAHVRSVLQNIQAVYPDYDSARGYELSGLVWFQGWNDMVDGGSYPDRAQPGGYDAYSEVLTHLIRDVRKELKAPRLPFVIGVMGAGGPTDQYGPEKKRYLAAHQSFRDAMAAPAALPEFQGNVAAVRTEKFWDMELNALVIRDGEINREVRKVSKEKKLGRKELEKLRAELRAKEFSARELEILEKGKSNAEYHYLGSGKIMLGIGKGFADAMAKMVK